MGGGGSGAQKDRQQEGYGRGVLGSPGGIWEGGLGIPEG